MAKVLLTGFEPFGGDSINPSWEAVQRIQEPEGVIFSKVKVPTVFATCLPTVETAVREQKWPGLIKENRHRRRYRFHEHRK